MSGAHLISISSPRYKLESYKINANFKQNIESFCKTLVVNRPIRETKQKRESQNAETMRLTLESFNKNKNRQNFITKTSFSTRSLNKADTPHAHTNKGSKSNLRSFSLESQLKVQKIHHNLLRNIETQTYSEITRKIERPPVQTCRTRKQINVDIKNWMERFKTQKHRFFENSEIETKNTYKQQAEPLGPQMLNFDEFYIERFKIPEINHERNDAELQESLKDKDVTQRVMQSINHKVIAKHKSSFVDKISLKINHKLLKPSAVNRTVSGQRSAPKQVKIKELTISFEKPQKTPSDVKSHRKKAIRNKSTRFSNVPDLKKQINLASMNFDNTSPPLDAVSELSKEFEHSGINLYNIISPSTSMHKNSKKSREEPIARLTIPEFTKHSQESHFLKINYLLSNLENQYACKSADSGIFERKRRSSLYDKNYSSRNTYWIACIKTILSHASCFDSDKIGYYSWLESKYVSQTFSKENLLSTIPQESLEIQPEELRSLSKFLLKLSRDIQNDHVNFSDSK